MTTRRRALLANIGLSAGSLALTVAVIEVATRACLDVRGPIASTRIFRESEDPGIGFELVPFAQVGADRVNSLGFRGPEVVVPKPPDVYRIVVLGDSQTAGGEGAGDSIPQLLEQFLNEEPEIRRRRRIEVVNAAVYTYNISQIYHSLVRKIPALKPDLVIYGFFGNDLSNMLYKPFVDESGNVTIVLYQMTDFGFESSDVLPAWIDRFWGRRLLSYNYAIFALKSALFRRAPVAGLEELPPEESANLHYLDDIVAAVARMGAGFLLVTIPSSRNASACDKDDYNFIRSHQIAVYARSRSIEVIMLDYVFCGTDLDLEKNRDSVHFTPSGHAGLAAELKNALMPFLLR